MSEVLRLEGVTIQIAGLRAVDQLSFAVEAGQIVSLIGPNGAGKTTTFNAISGYMRPTAGRVFLFGEDVTGQSPDRIAMRCPGTRGPDGLARYDVALTYAQLDARSDAIAAGLARRGIVSGTRTVLMATYDGGSPTRGTRSTASSHHLSLAGSNPDLPNSCLSAARNSARVALGKQEWSPSRAIGSRNPLLPSARADRHSERQCFQSSRSICGPSPLMAALVSNWTWTR